MPSKEAGDALAAGEVGDALAAGEGGDALAAGLAAELRANFEALGGLLDQLGEDDLARRLAPGEWSVAEILLHLVHAERWLQPQLLELRRAVAPALAVPGIGGVTLPDTESKLSVAELRWAGAAVREDTLRLLDGLERRQLREPANISVDGEVIDLSLRTMALTVADHQLFHLRQIERTLGRPAATL